MKNKEIKAEAIWNDEKKSGLNDFISTHSAKQSKERILKNKLLSIQYKLEDYIQNDTDDQVLRILDFVKIYLK